MTCHGVSFLNPSLLYSISESDLKHTFRNSLGSSGSVSDTFNARAQVLSLVGELRSQSHIMGGRGEHTHRHFHVHFHLTCDGRLLDSRNLSTITHPNVGAMTEVQALFFTEHTARFLEGWFSSLTTLEQTHLPISFQVSPGWSSYSIKNQHEELTYLLQIQTVSIRYIKKTHNLKRSRYSAENLYNVIFPTN